MTIEPCAPGDLWKESTSLLDNQDEPTGTEQVLDTVGALGTQIGKDAAHLFTSPLRIDETSALIAGGIAAGIGGLMVADKTMQQAFQENLLAAGVDRVAEEQHRNGREISSSWCDVENGLEAWTNLSTYRLCVLRGASNCVEPSVRE